MMQTRGEDTKKAASGVALGETMLLALTAVMGGRLTMAMTMTGFFTTLGFYRAHDAKGNFTD